MGDDNLKSEAIRRRRLVYRASHRGMKEMDVILGGFVTTHIDTLSDEEMGIMEQIIDIPDVDLLNWITGREEVPEKHRSALLEQILDVTVTPEDYTRS